MKSDSWSSISAFAFSGYMTLGKLHNQSLSVLFFKNKIVTAHRNVIVHEKQLANVGT